MGWELTHYNAVYHCWPVCDDDGSIKVLNALLAIQLLLDKTDLGAECIAEFITASYEICDANDAVDANVIDTLVVTFTLDNCSVNQSTARMTDKVMIGTHCHHLNLAAKVWTKDAFGGKLQNCLDQIHAVMK